MSTKTIDTLVEDIYSRLQNPRECDAKLVEEFGHRLASIVKERLSVDRSGEDPYLRMSNLGYPDRKLYYSIKTKEKGEEFTGPTLLKFLLGDVWEAVVLYLAKEAGHVVEAEQERVDVDGVKGSNDAIIDGVVVDVKSASPQSFKKFKEGSLQDNDPFGYMEQLAGYVEGHGGDHDGAFLACDKTLGHLHVLKVPNEDLKALAIRKRIEHLRGVLASDELPERCYEPVPNGVSGNLVLDVNCSYCPFKKQCWADANRGIGLRTFLYSKGPVHFTHIEKEPNVLELTF